MSTHEIELTIERIVLHDLPAVPRHRLLSAIEDALLRLLAADGLPADLAAEPIGLPPASIEVTPGASIETMAGQIARSIMASLRPGMEGAPPGAVPRGAQLFSQAHPSETAQGGDTFVGGTIFTGFTAIGEPTIAYPAGTDPEARV